MATMPHKHVTANVVYVDPSATGANDGSTPANARTTLPALGSLVASTVYLIRRGQTVTLAPGTASAKHALGIIGMPKPTDALYDAIPAEAKAAWDADADDYARIDILLNATTMLFENANGMSLFRLDVVSTQSIASPAVPFLTFTAVNMLSIERCKSRIDNIDLVAMSSYSAANMKLLTSWRITSSLGLHIRHCDFQRPWNLEGVSLAPTTVNGRACVVDISLSSGVFIEDCSFRYVLPGYASAVESSAGALRVTQFNCNTAVLRRLTFEMIDIRDNAMTHKTQPWSWLPAISSQFNGAVVDDITITARRIGTYPEPASPWNGCNNYDSTASHAVMSVATANNNGDTNGTMAFDLSNISIDLTGLLTALSGLMIAGGSGGSKNSRYNGRMTLKNYTFLCPATTASGVNDGGNNIDAPSGPVGLGVGPFSDLDLDGIDVRYTGIFAVAMDLGGRAVGNSYSGQIADFYQYNTGGNLRNAVAVGAVVCAGSAYFDFDSVTMPFVSTACVAHASNAAQVYIDNLVLPDGYVTTEEPVRCGDNAQLLVNNVNRVGNWAASISGINAHLALANADGVAGAWKSYTTHASAVTSAVYRTGGAAASLYVSTPTTPARTTGPWLAPYPYAPKFLDPGGTGRKILRVYLAVKGFTTKYRDVFAAIQIEITSPYGVYPRTRSYVSVSDGWMEEDGSVWNNEAGIVGFRISVPFLVDRYENIGVRVHISALYENAAYYYLDPKFEVVAG